MFVAIVLLLALVMHAYYGYWISKKAFPAIPSRYAWVIAMFIWPSLIYDAEWRWLGLAAKVGLALQVSYLMIVGILYFILHAHPWQILFSLAYSAIFLLVLVHALRYRDEELRLSATNQNSGC